MQSKHSVGVSASPVAPEGRRPGVRVERGKTQSQVTALPLHPRALACRDLRSPPRGWEKLRQ
eukprot:scaffold83105_cov67-Phaeocystis_antarctica.AAC.13